MALSLFIPNQPSTLVPTLLLLVLLHASLCQPSHGFSRYGRGISESWDPNNCGELVHESQCSQNPKCSWCTSENLDDTCFSKSEAWRLPHQVYSCGLIRWDPLYFALPCIRICSTGFIHYQISHCEWNHEVIELGGVVVIVFDCVIIVLLIQFVICLIWNMVRSSRDSRRWIRWSFGFCCICHLAAEKVFQVEKTLSLDLCSLASYCTEHWHCKSFIIKLSLMFINFLICSSLALMYSWQCNLQMIHQKRDLRFM